MLHLGVFPTFSTESHDTKEYYDGYSSLSQDASHNENLVTSCS